jgi:predicted ferric reductase
MPAAGVTAPARPRAPNPPISRDSTRWLLVIPIVVSAAVVWSWAHNLPAGSGAALTAVGQLTGLLASVYALLTVALMARVPVITDTVGSDRSIVWHRAAATATVAFLAVHIVAIVLGYAATDGASIIAEIKTLLLSYPDMLTAAVAAVLFGLISVSSIRAIRKRLRYESWLFAHWYAYPAVLLAFGHELSAGASFVHASWPTLLWTWLHVFVAGLVMWYRVLLPCGRVLSHHVYAVAVRPAGGRAMHIDLEGNNLGAYDPQPGQHLRLRVLDGDRWWQSHPFSFSAVPHRDRWRITVSSDGDYTRRIDEVSPGTRVAISGVYGHLRPSSRTRNRVALIAGGSGITPLRALIEAFPKNVDTRILYRAHSADDVILRSELDRLAHVHRSTVDYLIGPRNPNLIIDVLAPNSLLGLIPDLDQRDIYVCGHAGFVDTVCSSLHELGVPPARIHSERFDP